MWVNVFQISEIVLLRSEPAIGKSEGKDKDKGKDRVIVIFRQEPAIGKNKDKGKDKGHCNFRSRTCNW